MTNDRVMLLAFCTSSHLSMYQVVVSSPLVTVLVLCVQFRFIPFYTIRDAGPRSAIGRAPES